ncbi:MAG: glycosyltransferase [Clostridiales bacterium]|nr:glycosyltransferase [Clostridiales bacterium]
MVEKVLTVSIAAYNVQEYIRQCIESCLIPEVMDELEILVIDDGSTDCTHKIVDEYGDKYPDIVRVIHKENGGYGTTVNYGMKEATGKYFKLLDGDDYFERDGLIKLVKHLEYATSEMIVTKRKYISVDGKELARKEPLYYDFAPSTLKMDNDDCKFEILMHEVAYKTILLKQHPFELPERISYTDAIYSLVPAFFVDKIDFLECYVYCYRTNREGQTCSKENRIKRFQDLVQVNEQMKNQYTKHIQMSRKQSSSIIHRVAMTHCLLIKTCFLLPQSEEVFIFIKNLDKELNKYYPEIYREAFRTSKRIKILRLTNYIAYYPLSVLGKKNWY